MADVDNSTWDGGAAMAACSSAADYRAICAGERSVGDPDQRQHWALPHHKNPGAPPNAAGVRNSLGRLPQTQGLTNAAAARSHLEAHMRAINPEAASAPPSTGLVRMLTDETYELRAAEDPEAMPTMVGHMLRFNEWAEINSVFEGHFLEQIDPEAVVRTFEQDLPRMRVTFNHGKDPSIGDKVLGPIADLRADENGGWYEVPLLDTSYNRDLLPGLEAGLYGASFRFMVNQERFDRQAKRSEHNPDGLPERTILDMTISEFGPVTFPAYAGATAGLRSLTDEFLGRAAVALADDATDAVAAESASEAAQEPDLAAAARRPSAPRRDYTKRRAEPWRLPTRSSSTASPRRNSWNLG